MTTQLYRVHTTCQNCTDEWTYDLPRAFLVENQACRMCGCTTVRATSVLGVLDDQPSKARKRK